MQQGTGSSRTCVTTKFSDAEKQEINNVAYALSTPHETVTASDVIREAVRDYLDKYDKDPEACCPRERGGIDAVEA